MLRCLNFWTPSGQTKKTLLQVIFTPVFQLGLLTILKMLTNVNISRLVAHPRTSCPKPHNFVNIFILGPSKLTFVNIFNENPILKLEVNKC